jgi:hypothetical protein
MRCRSAGCFGFPTNIQKLLIYAMTLCESFVLTYFNSLALNVEEPFASLELIFGFDLAGSCACGCLGPSRRLKKSVSVTAFALGGPFSLVTDGFIRFTLDWSADLYDRFALSSFSSVLLLDDRELDLPSLSLDAPDALRLSIAARASASAVSRFSASTLVGW